MYLICVNVQFLWFPLSLFVVVTGGIISGLYCLNIHLIIFIFCLLLFSCYLCFLCNEFFGESKIFGRLTDSAFSVLSR